MEAQLKRGLLEICVLATLRNSESYGYKIIKDVSNVIPISESTLYPILKRLEANDCVTSYSVEHTSRQENIIKLQMLVSIKFRNFLSTGK